MVTLTFKRKLLIIAVFLISNGAFAQQPASETAVNGSQTEKKKKEKDPNDTTSKKLKIFKDEEPLQMSIAADIRAMIGEKKDTIFQPAIVRLKLPDSTEAVDTIEIRARGNFRRE